MNAMRDDRRGVRPAGPRRWEDEPDPPNRDGSDPYRALLNIRDVQRPLDAYQLLRLPRFEEDPDSIRAAASLQRMAMRLHRSEWPPDVWEQIKAELEEAISTLLDRDAKAAYDTALRVREATRTVVPRPAADPPVKRSRSSARCSQCGASNPPTRRYCSQCGKNLWEACYRCGTLCAAGDKYCGACGADLGAGVEVQRREFAARLRQAEELRQRCEFDEAIELVRPLAEIEHSRLSDLANRAKELVSQGTAQRDRCRAEADRARQEAKRLLGEGKLREAADAVRAVPAPFRDDSLHHLLAEAESRLQEIDALAGQLRRAAGSPFKVELLKKAARLLEIRPGHAEALAVIDRFRSRIVQMARAKLAERRYDEAHQLLEHLPPAAKIPEIEALHTQTNELRWLAAELGTAPAATRTLVALADRFRKLAPNDPQAAECFEQIAHRAKAGPDPRGAPLPWKAAPANSPFGAPVEWLTGFDRVQLHEHLDRSLLLEHPGRFFVACGLALQGLDLAPVATNLLPAEPTLLGRVALLMRKRIGRKTAWGLDLGASGLKAVKLAVPHDHHPPVIVAADLIEHRKSLSQAANEDESHAMIHETLQKFAVRNDLKADRVCLGLPCSMLLVRQVRMPRLDPAKMTAAIRFEAQGQFPIPFDELVWDYYLMGPEGEDAARGRQVEVAVMASKRVLIKDRVNRLQAAGLPVDTVQVDSVALHNYLVYTYLSDLTGPTEGEPGPAGPLAALDVGCEITSFVVSSPHEFWFRQVGLGADKLTRTIVRQLNANFAQAEQWKRNPAEAPRLDQLFETLEPLFDDFRYEIQSSLAAYAAIHPDRAMQRIVVLGGGLATHGLLRSLLREGASGR